MIHLSRYRILLLALFLALVGICLRGVAIKTETTNRPAQGKVEEPGVPAVETNAISMIQGKAGRSREANASAKLRSLLTVRQGELAIVRLPAEMATEGLGVSLLGPAAEASGPTILNVADVERFSRELEARVSQDDPIDGAVQTADGSFEWRSSNFEIKGQSLPNSDEETTLVLNLRFGDRELVTTFTANVGSMFVVHPGGGTEDAVLMVVGGEKAGAAEGR